MIDNVIEEYQEYVNKVGRRVDLYRTIASTFDVSSALYPGCHIDLDPSLVIPNVTYIDNFKGAIKFFTQSEEIQKYLDNSKEYNMPCTFNFIPEDYNNTFSIDSVDLIISQFAGFVGQSTKKYLKSGGILLCNDSHGDATMAKFDKDFEFIGIVDNNNNIDLNNLDEYFTFKRQRPINLDWVRLKRKGPKYKTPTSNYIFRKL